jgi:hypothetical protein
VLTAVAIKKWAIFFVEKNKGVVENFCKVLRQQAPRMGIEVAQPKIVALPNDKTETYLKAMRDLIDETVQGRNSTNFYA